MNLENLLRQRALVVMDGAMGTRLMAGGLEAGECGDLWNLERPEAVVEILRSYADAGADCLLTNTFGANPVALGRHGLEEKTEAINKAAVEIASRAGGEDVVVFGGLGPTGGILEPYGDLTEAAAREAYGRQATALAGAGADALLCETFESSEELRLALEAAAQACGLPLVASMKFSREPSGRYRTMMGEGPEHLADAAEELGCVAAGVNCGHGIEEMVPLVSRLAELTDLPLFAKPNAGMPELVEGQPIYAEDPSVFQRFVPSLYEAGARIIGGCCGTTAGHIEVIRRFADSL